MSKKIELDIIIPVYNEGKLIVKTLTEIERSVKIPHRTIVIYDLENDSSLPFLRSIVRQGMPVQLVRNYLGGVINAMKTGFRAAQAPVVVTFMGDFSYESSQINIMMERIKSGFDVVCASRYMPGGAKIGGPKLKTFLSKFACLSLHFLTGIPTRDVTSVFTMYKKKLLDSISIESVGGFEYAMEIAIKAYFDGFKITEVPTVRRERVQGQSKFKLLRWLPGYLKWYYYAIGRAWWRASYLSFIKQWIKLSHHW